ncbi:winged helix-turn-helix domain-containing protein [Actinomadura rudentiformis]|uniref:Helix-turn-helix domain-containing protein n=1 Tax=Actinomadura rudentiformis TaxID=359158 RepID=A0A6H9Z0B9_9ACTN|nr:transcriptional regulator [Actinomadura rudentiformis]KAB2350155.1 helix-turn-helix domain-containing protein [Actinomadura rudentiformis]
MTGAHFDEFIHVPARLSILAMLAPTDWVEFRVLRDHLGTSDSALSKQISALNDAGYVDVRKERLHGQRSTRIRLTPHGRAAFQAHALALEEIVAAARKKPGP